MRQIASRNSNRQEFPQIDFHKYESALILKQNLTVGDRLRILYLITEADGKLVPNSPPFCVNIHACGFIEMPKSMYRILHVILNQIIC